MKNTLSPLLASGRATVEVFENMGNHFFSPAEKLVGGVATNAATHLMELNRMNMEDFEKMAADIYKTSNVNDALVVWTEFMQSRMPRRNLAVLELLQLNAIWRD